MRIRFAALMVITLATTITFLTGCSKETSNTTNANASNSTANISASPAATATQPASTTAPTTPMTSGSGGATPTDAFTAYYEAIKRKDVDAVKNVFSKDTISMMEERAKKSNTSVDAVMKEGLEGASKDIPAEAPKTRNEKVDGDKATVEVRDEKKDKWELVHFVREDGQWKVAFDEK